MSSNEYDTLIREREAQVPDELRAQILECMRKKNMTVGQTHEFLGATFEEVADVVYVYLDSISKESKRLSTRAVQRIKPQAEHKFFKNGELRDTFQDDLRELDEVQIHQVIDFLTSLLPQNTKEVEL